MPPQNEIVKDALALIKYDSGGFQTGEVTTSSNADFPHIRWDLHLATVSPLRGHFSKPAQVLNRMDPKSQFAVVFSPEGGMTKDMCTWISVAALLGFDVLPHGNRDAKPQIVIIHYDDYDHSELLNAIELLERCGIKVPYAPPIKEEETMPFRDVSKGLLEIGHKVADWTEYDKRKIKVQSVPPSKTRMPIPRVRYIGKLAGPLHDYFEGRNAQAIHDGITKHVETLIRDSKMRFSRKDTPDPVEFVSMISLGHYTLPVPPAQKWIEPKEAWHVRQTLENTDIIANADREVDDSIDAVVGIVEDYIQIWKGCCEYYCMMPELSKFVPGNRKGIFEIAEFTGAKSAIEAYASGVAVEDILA